MTLTRASSSPTIHDAVIYRQEVASLVFPDAGPLSTRYIPLLTDGHYDMNKEKGPHLDINLESDHLFLKGTGVDFEPAYLSGQVVLTLTEPTSLKEITLQFRGKARLPIPANESAVSSATVLTYLVCNHESSFLEGDRKHGHTLKAGHHVFPFQLRIGGSLPSSIFSREFGDAAVTYRLRVQATRPGLSPKLQANVQIHIIRSLAREALEYQQTLEIENTWPGKLMYSIMLPHKAWAAGDSLTAVVKFSPLVKGTCILSVMTSLQESATVYAQIGLQEYSRVVASVTHAIIEGKAVEVDCDYPRGSGKPAVSGATYNSIQTWENSHPRLTESQRANLGANDVVTSLTMLLPFKVTPTHALEPIIVSHRVRWNILIANPDGHTSELRCSLPIHLLDGRLLQEARRYTAATRQVLLGGPGMPPEEQEDMELPSYASHARDRIANVYVPEVVALYPTNPCVASSTRPVSRRGGPNSQPRMRSDHSPPLEVDLVSHLPHVPSPENSSPLNRTTSELLLQQINGRNTPRTSHEHRHSATNPQVSHSANYAHSRPTSRRSNHPTSRSASPNSHYGHSRPSSAATNKSVHIPGHGRNFHGLLKATMKPFASITHNHRLSRTGSASGFSDPQLEANYAGRFPGFPSSLPLGPAHPQSPPLSELTRCCPQRQQTNIPAVIPGIDLSLIRALTEVPNYEAASRGFIGGLPPLTSLQSLPSYEASTSVRLASLTLAQSDASVGSIVLGRGAQGGTELASRLAATSLVGG
ncbi:hypothetical protein AX17_001482 [Amanita inopinata Kibby_2008]|nr:hypothetical protein AX17_001482 [Amanita inopinata Kibby_2008]